MLDADQSHHLARVLRIEAGACVCVFDGEGSEWECEVVAAGKREVVLRALRQLTEPVESGLDLTLAQSLIKGDKFDWVVQKATELGVTRIIPLLTDNSDIKRAEERSEQKLQRWRRISLEAVKQCGRRRLVEIAEPISFMDFCETPGNQIRLIFSERGGRRLRQIAPALPQTGRISVCVASEGSWSERELQKAEESGLIPVYLGARVLRTETAGMIAVALAQHVFGDLY